MNKTTLRVSKMDCSAESSIIDMKVRSLPGIVKLDFDIAGRTVAIFHEGSPDIIVQTVDSLRLGSILISTQLVQSDLVIENIPNDKKILWTVLGINIAFFFIEFGFGYLGRSMGLVADSLDMFADALVYGLSLYAVGQSQVRKKNVAAVCGYLQILLAVLGMVAVVHRFIKPEHIPSFSIMMTVSFLALLGNATSLWLLNRAQTGEVHIKASAICTSNDVIANMGVIVAGFLVFLTHSPYPDLIVGTIVFFLVARGALTILKLAK